MANAATSKEGTSPRSKLRPHEIAHPTLSPDTDPEAEKVQLQIFRNMPLRRKAELIGEAIEASRALSLAGLRARHPEAGPEELRRRLFGLELGEELATRVYGPLPERRP
jgi:SpoVK/Ycf46/Vps4 family AAA+-type ATPase